REQEVLALLVKGRSIPYICDELFVAKSTAQTHVRHIYAKMEITGGRQELIDIVEGTATHPA
ncbi:MAG: helix-turn-helix transcriptional regulator, partial [Raoultibacter sp.]